MLDNFEAVQSFADALKRLLLEATDIPTDQRLKALNLINGIERCRWHSIAMAEAIMKANYTFEPSNGQYYLLTFPESEKVSEHLPAAIERIYNEYSQLIDCDEVLDQIYTMEEAAIYLGVVKDTMKKYVSRQKRLRGKMVGKSMIFTKRQLDDFKRELEA